jgi:MYXO-CTERM domain-containing protein
MSHRLIATLFALLVTAAVSHAGPLPLRWGWTLTSPAGEVFGRGSGLTADSLAINGSPALVVDAGPPPPPLSSDFTNTAYYVQDLTSVGRITLIDERTNATAAFDLIADRQYIWKLNTNPDGSTTPEMIDGYAGYGPDRPPARLRAGGLLFEVEQYDAYGLVSVTAAETPEPGTLILAGVALAGGLAAWRRRPTPARQA